MPMPPRTFTRAQIEALTKLLEQYPVPSPLKPGLGAYAPWTSPHRIHRAALEYAQGDYASIKSACRSWCVSIADFYEVVNQLGE